ncbi:alpha/beta hydrolase [Streptomyces sp. NPDC005492]|uniref:alpha/beta fold hydrolase n=1 Tax=Streptomyces sp. NPDC005492 TaxID=3156883 RepID=UPI00339E7DC3
MTLRSNVLKVKGRSTEVLVAGSGAPVVYMHGAGIIAGFEFLTALSHRFRVVAPLMPGYGATEPDPLPTSRDEVAEHTRDVLDTLGIERTVLVEHSVGGWLAAAFAAIFPERVTLLVLAAPFGIRLPGYPAPDLGAMSPQERAGVMTSDPGILRGRLPDRPDPVFTATRARERAALRGFLPGPVDPELPAVLPRIGMPTRLVWGEDDQVSAPALVGEWHRAIPHAMVRTVRGGGHLLLNERPDILPAVLGDPRAQEVTLPT